MLSLYAINRMPDDRCYRYLVHLITVIGGLFNNDVNFDVWKKYFIYTSYQKSFSMKRKLHGADDLCELVHNNHKSNDTRTMGEC